MFLKNSSHHIFTASKTLSLNNTFAFRSRKTVKNNKKTNLSLQNLPLSLHPTAPTLESLLALRVRLHETRKINLALRATRTQNTALLSSLTSLLSPPPNSTFPETPSIAFLTHHLSAAILGLTFTPPSSTSAKPLTTHAAFALSQLPALREKLQELRPKLKILPEAGARVDWEGKREDRRRYIEGRVKRVFKAEDGDGGVEVRGAREEEKVREFEGVVRGLRRGGDVKMDG